MFEYKESILKEVISELRKVQVELRKTNESLKSERLLMLAKQTENFVGNL